MVIGPDTVREPRRDEFDEIHDLLVAAFDTPAEAKLVRQLRNDGAMAKTAIPFWLSFAQSTGAFSQKGPFCETVRRRCFDRRSGQAKLLPTRRVQP